MWLNNSAEWLRARRVRRSLERLRRRDPAFDARHLDERAIETAHLLADAMAKADPAADRECPEWIVGPLWDSVVSPSGSLEPFGREPLVCVENAWPVELVVGDSSTDLEGARVRFAIWLDFARDVFVRADFELLLFDGAWRLVAASTGSTAR